MATVDLRVSGGVAVLTLQRPAKHNAMNPEMAREFSAALRGEFRALVVTGNERAFCAGADLAEGSDGWLDALDALAALPQPTFAAIEGWCLGGGLELAIHCDFRVAGDTAKLGTPEVLRGIFPGGGGTSRLPKLVGPSRAKELMFFGEPVDAATALQWGLANRVVSAGRALAEATAMAAKLAAGAPLAISLIKGIVDDGHGLPLEQAVALERERGSRLHGSEDAAEGVRAFLEKREPRFTGR